MKFLLKLLIAILLPFLAYWTAINLPVLDHTWRAQLNNFCWFAMFIYYVIYLPLWGLRLSARNWVFKVLSALVGVALVVTTFNYVLAERNNRLKTEPSAQSK